MSSYADLSTDSFVGSGERLRAIGWLSLDHDFPRGRLDGSLLDRIKHHISTAYQPVAYGGWHDCEFCGNYKGFGNLWIPTPELVYVAPEMIVHYIEEHRYLPPREFCEAVVACPIQGSPEFMSLLAPFRSYFRISAPDPLPTPEQQSQLAKLLTKAFEDIARLCRRGEVKAAEALADACAHIPAGMHGWGHWYWHIFSRGVRNGRLSYPALDDYLREYNSIFGGDSDPELTAYEAEQAAARDRRESSA